MGKSQNSYMSWGFLNIGEGTLVATNQRVATSLHTPYEQLREWVKTDGPNVHVDETPWTVKGVKEWLLFVANQNFCLFHAAFSALTRRT